MNSRSVFSVVTAIDGRAVRLGYYEGQDTLTLRHDIRARELQGVTLPDFMVEGPQEDDPVKFLREAFDIPEGLSRPGLEATRGGTRRAGGDDGGYAH